MAVVPLGQRFLDAIGWAFELHGDQARKGSTIPYVSHLLAVASLVLEAGGDETDAVAAMLHDALEDRPAGTAALTVEDFTRRLGDLGPRVFAIVDANSDRVPGADPSERRGPDTWRERKQHHLDALDRGDLDPSVRRVGVADKIANARSIIADLRNPHVGRSVWERFHAPEPKAESVLWYYRELATRHRTMSDDVLTRTLSDTVEELARLDAELA